MSFLLSSGHISGLTQTVLFLLLCGIQIALSLQEWALRNTSSYVDRVIIGAFQTAECTESAKGILLRLIYVAILLAAQLLLSPFIVSSQRNYREGLLFCLGSLSSLVIWIGWTIPFILLDPGWNNIILSCGLVATPTALIVLIFLPKVRDATETNFGI